MSLHPCIERLALLGWRLYPCAPSRKGMFKGYVQAATSDLPILDRWSRRYPGCNWSVIPEGSGIWALDADIPSCDHDADGVAALQELCRKFGELPPRPHGLSGGGGHLLVFRQTGDPIWTKTGYTRSRARPARRPRCLYSCTIHSSPRWHLSVADTALGARATNRATVAASRSCATSSRSHVQRPHCDH